MSKSIKLKDDNYIDISSIAVQRNVILNKYIKMHRHPGTHENGITYPYRKLLTIKIKEEWRRTFLKFVAIDWENGSFIFDGEIIVGSNGSGTHSFRHFTGSFSYKGNSNIKMILYLESNTNGNLVYSIWCYAPVSYCTIYVGVVQALNLDDITLDCTDFSASEPDYSKEIVLT